MLIIIVIKCFIAQELITDHEILYFMCLLKGVLIQLSKGCCWGDKQGYGSVQCFFGGSGSSAINLQTFQERS